LIANPFAYDDYRERIVRDKIEKERSSRIRATNKLPAVNKELAKKLLDESKTKKAKKEGKVNPMDDDRFRDMFADADFQVDQESNEYKLLHPTQSVSKEGVVLTTLLAKKKSSVTHSNFYHFRKRNDKMLPLMMRTCQMLKTYNRTVQMWTLMIVRECRAIAIVMMILSPRFVKNAEVMFAARRQSRQPFDHSHMRDGLPRRRLRQESENLKCVWAIRATLDVPLVLPRKICDDPLAIVSLLHLNREREATAFLERLWVVWKCLSNCNPRRRGTMDRHRLVDLTEDSDVVPVKTPLEACNDPFHFLFCCIEIIIQNHLLLLLYKISI
jgi:NUC153 domain